MLRFISRGIVRFVAFAATLFGGFSSGLSVGEALAADPGSRIVYGGRLEDVERRPIGGIYPLTFSFYRTEKGGRAVWTEAHFVAVDNGIYGIELGRDKPFSKGLDLERAWLGIAITGGKEIVRERFSPDPKTAPTRVAPEVPKSDPQVGVPPQTPKGSYADLAGFAYEAEKAKNSNAIGGLTAADLRTMMKQAVAEPGREGGKAKIGETRRYTEQAGGGGGSVYTLQCPAGYVVTGIRGQAAAYVDQISLICSPLE